MINIIKKEIDVEEHLRKILEIICDFCNTTPTIINCSIRKVDKTNLSYIEPHKIIINNNVFLAFNYSNEIYINNLSRKTKINELENYIKQVDKTNDEYKNIQILSVTLNNVDKRIQGNQKEIQTLTENNEALQLRVDTLNKNNKVKDKQIKDLKEEKLSFRQLLSFCKDKFLEVISFIKDKLFGREKEREKYMDVAEDLYSKKIIEEGTFEDYKTLMNLVKITIMREIKMILIWKFSLIYIKKIKLCYNLKER